MSAPPHYSSQKSLEKLLGTFERLPRPLLVGGGLALIYLAGYVDYLTGNDISPQILYLIPIGIVAWCAGRKEGFLLAVNSGMARLLADWINVRGSALGLTPHWNAGSHFIIAMAFAWLLSSLRARLAQEQELARTDALTGVCNARSFAERATLEIERARRKNSALTVAYVDCDNFKQVNDRFGHAIGDELLKTVAQTMRQSVRPFDLVARVGGDEFALLLPEASATQALAALERVRERLLAAMQTRSWPVTFSIGAMTFSAPPASVAEMLREADEVMYGAKRGGKDKIAQAVLPAQNLISDKPLLRKDEGGRMKDEKGAARR